MDKQIVLSGFFNEEVKKKIENLSQQFAKDNILLLQKNYLGEPLAFFDITSVEFISVTYEILQYYVLSGSYDWFKYKLTNIWNDVYKDKKFSLSIQGIPLNNEPENITVTASGKVSDEQKNTMIDKIYELANKIIDKEYELKERNQFYQAMQTHPFIFNSSDNTLTEVDTAEEIYKKAKKNRD